MPDQAIRNYDSRLDIAICTLPISSTIASEDSWQGAEGITHVDICRTTKRIQEGPSEGSGRHRGASSGIGKGFVGALDGAEMRRHVVLTPRSVPTKYQLADIASPLRSQAHLTRDDPAYRASVAQEFKTSCPLCSYKAPAAGIATVI